MVVKLTILLWHLLFCLKIWHFIWAKSLLLLFLFCLLRLRLLLISIHIFFTLQLFHFWLLWLTNPLKSSICGLHFLFHLLFLLFPYRNHIFFILTRKTFHNQIFTIWWWFFFFYDIFVDLFWRIFGFLLLLFQQKSLLLFQLILSQSSLLYSFLYFNSLIYFLSLFKGFCFFFTILLKCLLFLYFFRW